MAKERIGILGGTFDPIHQGHIRMALSALEAMKLDRVLMMPGGQPPHKSGAAPAQDRWRMTVMACSQDPRLQPCSLEIDRPGDSYTVDTLRELQRQSPKAEYFYIVGADAMMKLRHWVGFDQLRTLCTFLVCPRANSADPAAYSAEKRSLLAAGARVAEIDMSPIPVSSTGLRAAIAEDRPTPSLDVFNQEYCTLRGLYGASPRVEEADAWLAKLFEALNPRRFAHSLAVAATARKLALLHGANPLQAEQAGLLHDCAKCLPMKEMRRIAVEHSLTADPTVLESGALLHSLAGAWVARNEYGMADPEVLDAIAYHNTGAPGMSRLAMCVCLADSIEPTRESYPLLEYVRQLSELSLERALLLSLDGTARYVQSRGKYLHPRTQDTIAWLKTLPETRSGSASGRGREWKQRLFSPPDSIVTNQSMKDQ